MKTVVLVLLLLISLYGAGQTCTNIGQNPSTAFPVCGTSIFKQTSVPLCGNHALPSPCKRDGVTDTNPFWYKFTCFQDGTLGFLITPNNLGDDYDWELYDITGHNPNEVFVDGNLPIACNWSGEKGLTGTSTGTNGFFVCGGYGKPLFSNMPFLKAGHNYLLLVSHFDPFTNSTEGYTLEFKGGSAVITDPTPPALKSANVNCGADKIAIKLNKRMLCSSIAADGSDFYIDPIKANSIAGSGIACSAKFDTDSIEITLSQPLPPGDYTLKVKVGTDGNTILDFCGNGIPITDQVPFTVLPSAPVPMDSLSAVSCAPQQLTLVFKKNISCKSIAADGSDFLVTGSYPVNVTAAAGNCTENYTREIIVTLNKPLQQKGDFKIQLKRGTDGNTILDECSEETPAGASLPFTIKDTVSADFTYDRQYGCSKDLVYYRHPGSNEVNSWKWNLDESLSSSQQNPTASYSIFSSKQVSLTVSNGFCNDTATETVVLDNFIKAGFSVPEDNCPLEPITFNSESVGNSLTHFWNFGDGNSSAEQSPVHTYQRFNNTRELRVQYTITDSIGCTSTIEKNIKIYVSCFIDVPSAFTPNGDGKNDVLYPLNAVKAENLLFNVYNRWGQLVYSTRDWKKGWDGQFNSVLQESGLYVWTLNYTDRDSKKQFSLKGKTMLLR
ncbi:T9SS type B sorting domain-containing protein [Flavihumibacter profundi]|uniref:T9SS type B sorting domain-containing protein n=1 Tax=Flavihumibacter profundi TaxID=2716883 RepID=UPI001CC6824E|nr:gliding motility-associated C-terminal domain-containing protein [Flavihumibacter profundi]MBZ5856781.1 gliding motility-associated C-terminal domain-containing protein [Flavihumibacter profundi]